MSKNGEEQPFWLGIIVDRFMTIISWLFVFISPTLIGLLSGGIVYLSLGRRILGVVCGSLLLIFGIAVGIWWAERVRKTIGTTELMNILQATPDFDKKPKDPNKK